MRPTLILLIVSLLSGCETLSDKENLKWIAGAAAVGAIAYYAGKGGGVGAGYAALQDAEWDWDLQPAPYGGTQWVCRGVQTAQYAEQWRCANKIQTDYRWPG